MCSFGYIWCILEALQDNRDRTFSSNNLQVGEVYTDIHTNVTTLGEKEKNEKHETQKNGYSFLRKDRNYGRRRPLFKYRVQGFFKLLLYIIYAYKTI